MKKTATVDIEYCNARCPHFYYNFEDGDRIWCGLSNKMIFDNGDVPYPFGDFKDRQIPKSCLLPIHEKKIKREIRITRNFLNIIRHINRNDHNHLIDSIEVAYYLIIHEFGKDEEFGGNVFVYIDLSEGWLHLRVSVDPSPDNSMERIEKIRETLENTIPYSGVELVGVTT